MRQVSSVSRVFLLVFVLCGLVAAAPTAAQSPCHGNEPDSPGLLSASEYQGEIFGNHVTWDDMWEVGEMSNERVAQVVGPFSQPVDCEGNTGDRLTLVHRLSPSTVLEIQTYQRGLWTFESMVADMEHPGWTANLGLEQGSNVLLSGSTDDTVAMLARDTADPDHLAYIEIHFPAGEDTIMSYTLHTWDVSSVLSPVLNDLDASVEMDGLTPFTVHDQDTIEAAAG